MDSPTMASVLTRAPLLRLELLQLEAPAGEGGGPSRGGEEGEEEGEGEGDGEGEGEGEHAPSPRSMLRGVVPAGEPRRVEYTAGVRSYRSTRPVCNSFAWACWGMQADLYVTSFELRKHAAFEMR